MGKWSWLLCVLVGCYYSSSAGDDDDDGPGPGPRPDACTPVACEAIGATCGAVDDGCGGSVECGTCAEPAMCAGQGTANVCAIPTAQRTCASGWCFEAPAPIPFAPNAMFAVSPADVWAVGNRGVVMHFDGTHWELVPAATTADLADIWMASATDGWLVGTAGSVRRWNGAAWTAVTSGTTANLHGVHGTSPTNVLVVGPAVSRRWNGSQFANLTVTTPALDDVTVVGSTTWAVGAGRVWRLDGAGAATQWTSVTSGVDSLPDIASAGTAAFAIGRDFSFTEGEEVIYRLDGATWTAIAHPGDPTWTSIFTDGDQIFGASDESMINLASFARVLGPPGYAVVTAGASGKRFSATIGGQLWNHDGAWLSDGYGARFDLQAIAAVGDTVWIGDTAGTVYEWRNGLVPHHVHTRPITAIAGTSRSDVWVANDFDIAHFDGAIWDLDAGPPFGDFNALVYAGDTLFSLGDRVYRRSGADWIEETVPTASGLEWFAAAAHDDEVFAVGHETFSSTPVSHVIKRASDGTWTELPPANVEALCGIAVISPTDIWAVGHDGKDFPDTPTAKVSHFDGTKWTTITRPNAQQLCTVEIVNGEVWASGDGSDIHRRATTGAWTVERPLATGSIRGLRAVGGELWGAGSHGAVIRR